MDSSLFSLISEFRGWRIYLPLLAGEVASHRSESRGAELPHILPPVCRRPGGITQTTETSLTRSVPCKCCQYSHWSCLPSIEWKTFFWNLHVIFKWTMSPEKPYLMSNVLYFCTGPSWIFMNVKWKRTYFFVKILLWLACWIIIGSLPFSYWNIPHCSVVICVFYCYPVCCSI